MTRNGRIEDRRRVAMIAVALALCVASSSTAQQFTMAEPLLSSLNALADTATVEHARCLFGITRPNSAVADSATEPEVTRRAGLIVSLKPCPFGAIALWHVHVLAQTRASSPEAACFLSPGDIETGMRRDAPIVMVVHVGAAVWCWWSREDVLDAKLIRLITSPPPFGHLQRLRASASKP